MLSLSDRANSLSAGFLLERGIVTMTRLVIINGMAGTPGGLSDHTGIRVPAGSVALIIESIAILRTMAVMESVNRVAGGDPRAASSFAILSLTAFAIATESARVSTTGTGAATAAGAVGAATEVRLSAAAFALAGTAAGFAIESACAALNRSRSRSSPLNAAAAAATAAVPKPVMRTIFRLRDLTAGRTGVAGTFTSPDEVVMLSSAVISASAVGGLSFGSLARHCMMMAESGGGTSGHTM